jgi:hypothetical protein
LDNPRAQAVARAALANGRAKRRQTGNR